MLAGLRFDAPDRVEGILELTEHAARAEKRERDSDHGSQNPFARMRSFLCNVLYDLDRARVKKVTHLLRDLVPRTCRIVVEKQSHHRE